jgi:hypothetical protein
MNFGGFKSIGSESWRTRNEKKMHTCPICKIDIANHPRSIRLHEKSQTHIEMRDELLANGGRRTKTNALPVYQKQDDYTNEIHKIELAAAQAFQSKDNKFGHSGIGDRLNSFLNQNTERVSNLGYIKPSGDDDNFSIDQIKNDPSKFTVQIAISNY